MTDFCTITASRDRPRMLKFCRQQLDRQNIQPKASYFINYDATDSQPDLVKRIRSGIELAERADIDIVYIVEDDDSYKSNYFELTDICDNDFIGYSDTFYYSLKSKTWMHQYHPGRSSLFCTGFRISALKDFRWPPEHYLWLDIKLWEFARDAGKKVKLMDGNPCLGIKGHMEGMHAGKSHNKTFEHKDYDYMFLRSRTDDFQYKFLTNWK